MGTIHRPPGRTCLQNLQHVAVRHKDNNLTAAMRLLQEASESSLKVRACARGLTSLSTTTPHALASTAFTLGARALKS
jgi:hypothetical protein